METLDRKFFDHVWVLWNNLQDVDSSEMVEACIFFIEEYDFDMDVLPGGSEYKDFRRGIC